MGRYNPRKEQNLIRRTGCREVKQSFLIVCEGENTEPCYFNSFRLTSATVKAVGKGRSTVRLVQEAISIAERERAKGRKYSQQCVAFDKDDFSSSDFDGAIRLAENNGFRVAYSNQAFEFWFLLHFNDYRGHIDRSTYGGTLSKLLGTTYSKKEEFASKIYGILLPRQAVAIKRAKSILEEFTGMTPSRAESSTTVFRLVEELNRYI